MGLNMSRKKQCCAFAKVVAAMSALALGVYNQPLQANPGQDAASIRRAERTQRIEDGFLVTVEENGAPLQVSLQKLMHLYNVPGLSVAVIDNFEIDWVKGYG